LPKINILKMAQRLTTIQNFLIAKTEYRDMNLDGHIHISEERLMRLYLIHNGS